MAYDNVQWLSNNLPWIREKYKNRWVAVYENKIIASNNEPAELIRKTRGLHESFITFIPEDEIIRDFAFGV